jgi:hypothetical protein
MKRLIFAASAAVIVIVVAIAVVITTSNHTATATQAESTKPETETTQPESTQPETEKPETEKPETEKPEATESGPEVPLTEMMEERLQDLVDRGFITQEQLDEMEGWLHDRGPGNGEFPEGLDLERFSERGPWNGRLHDNGDPERFLERELGPRGFGFLGRDEAITDLLGLTPEELMEALAEGTPLADIVDDADALVDSIVGPLQERLDRAVESGDLTEAEASELIAEARSRAEAFINGERLDGEGFLRQRGPSGFRGSGGFGPHRGDDADAETTGYAA